MLNDEEYSSDTDDEDYQPSAAEESDAEPSDEEKVETNETSRAQEFEEERVQISEEKKLSQEKKKSDDLWAMFMSDVGPRPKVAETQSSKTKQNSESSSLLKQSTNRTEAISSSHSSPKSSMPMKIIPQRTPGTVTVTKEYDFAGETVRVSKEVSSEAAKVNEAVKSTTSNNSLTPTFLGKKRPVGGGGGLGGLLDKIGKKQKISTLEKSRMDWNSFKKEENIEAELESHNKSNKGYLDRKAFLERSDLRQFEIEKSLRLGSSSKR